MKNLIIRLEESEMANTFGGGWVELIIDGVEYTVYIVD